MTKTTQPSTMGKPASLFTWGNGNQYQLGNGVSHDVRFPIVVFKTLDGDNVHYLAAGAAHSVVVLKNGSVYTWGEGLHGQLGHMERKEEKFPRRVVGLDPCRVTSVSCGEMYTAALTDTGDVYTWGTGLDCTGKAEPPSIHLNSTKLKPKVNHDENAIEPTDSTFAECSPRRVMDLIGRNIKLIAAGKQHMMALSAEGMLFAWGHNSRGQLGLGSYDDHPRPTIVDTLLDHRLTHMSCGAYHSAAVTKEGELWTWGAGGDGRLGHGDEDSELLPIPVQSLVKVARFKACACGDRKTLALTNDGVVYGFGLDHGQLCSEAEEQLNPIIIRAFSDTVVTQIKCGGNFAVAITADGELYTWGLNDHGQLGRRSVKSLLGSPDRLADCHVHLVAAGSTHVIALATSHDSKFNLSEVPMDTGVDTGLWFALNSNNNSGTGVAVLPKGSGLTGPVIVPEGAQQAFDWGTAAKPTLRRTRNKDGDLVSCAPSKIQIDSPDERHGAIRIQRLEANLAKAKVGITDDNLRDTSPWKPTPGQRIEVGEIDSPTPLPAFEVVKRLFTPVSNSVEPELSSTTTSSNRRGKKYSKPVDCASNTGVLTLQFRRGGETGRRRFSENFMGKLDVMTDEFDDKGGNQDEGFTKSTYKGERGVAPPRQRKAVVVEKGRYTSGMASRFKYEPRPPSSARRIPSPPRSPNKSPSPTHTARSTIAPTTEATSGATAAATTASTPTTPAAARPMSARPASSRPLSARTQATRPSSARATAASGPPLTLTAAGGGGGSGGGGDSGGGDGRGGGGGGGGAAAARPSSARPASTRPGSARPSSARPASARPGSARPSSARPASARPASARTRPTSARPSSARRTVARNATEGMSTSRGRLEFTSSAEADNVVLKTAPAFTFGTSQRPDIAAHSTAVSEAIGPGSYTPRPVQSGSSGRGLLHNLTTAPLNSHSTAVETPRVGSFGTGERFKVAAEKTAIPHSYTSAEFVPRKTGVVVPTTYHTNRFAYVEGDPKVVPELDLSKLKNAVEEQPKPQISPAVALRLKRCKEKHMPVKKTTFGVSPRFPLYQDEFVPSNPGPIYNPKDKRVSAKKSFSMAKKLRSSFDTPRYTTRGPGECDPKSAFEKAEKPTRATTFGTTLRFDQKRPHEFRMMTGSEDLAHTMRVWAEGSIPAYEAEQEAAAQ